MSYKISTRLTQLAHAVADQNWSEFSMRIPADSEHDADLVLLSAAREITRLRAELKYQTDNSARLQRSMEGLHWRIRGLEFELTEATKPTCNACASFHSCWSRSWNNPNWAREHCPDGRLFERVAAVRLYEKEGDYASRV